MLDRLLLAAIIIALIGFALWQDRLIGDLRSDVSDAIDARQAAERAIVVLADHHAAELARKTVVQEGKEAILSLNSINEPEIAPSLRMGLETADRLGGLE